MDGYAEFSLDALLANILASSAIESEILDVYGGTLIARASAGH